MQGVTASLRCKTTPRPPFNVHVRVRLEGRAPCQPLSPWRGKLEHRGRARGGSVQRVIERMLAIERSTYLSIVCFCFLMICPLPLSPPLAWYLECSSASSLSRSAAFPAILSVEPAQPGIHGPLLCAFCLSAKSVTSPPCTLCALTPDPETNFSRLKQPSQRDVF